MLVKSVYRYITEKWWFAATAVGRGAISFANEAPIIYQSLIGIDISIIDVATIRQCSTLTNAAVGGSRVAVWLIRIFVVVTKIVVPHQTYKIAAVVVKLGSNWLILNFFLYDTFTIVLVQRFSINFVLRQINIFNQ